MIARSPFQEDNNMKSLMMTAFLVAMLLSAGSVIGAQVSIGIRIGPPPAPRVVRVTPTRPGSDFTWVAGYWYPVGNHYKWHDGYWTRPPYASARWMSPHHDGQMFYNGYWEGDKGRIDHDHKWDRDKKRRDNRS
jgi:hypothetical protein